MKKIFLALFTMLFVSTAVFAQSDLQVLAVVNLNKSESITVKQLKKRVGNLEMISQQKLSVEDKKTLLNTMIDEKLIVQAAQKAGISIPDSVVNQNFEAQISQLMSQLLGAPTMLTEKQFDDFVKQQFNMTGDEFFKQQLGLTKADIKENLKTHLIMQQYVLMQKQQELTKIGPTPDEIKMFYQNNKSQFVQNDIAQMLRVDVKFGDDKKASKVKINELRNKVIDKKVTVENLISGGTVEGAGYIAQRALIEKSQAGLSMIGYPSMTLENFYKLLGQNIGYVSDIIETPDSYSFVSIIKKYDAKMLGLNDPITPENANTVYDYIRAGLTQQMVAQYLQDSIVAIAAELHTDKNVEMKKSGDALDKLLNWGE